MWKSVESCGFNPQEKQLPVAGVFQAGELDLALGGLGGRGDPGAVPAHGKVHKSAIRDADHGVEHELKVRLGRDLQPELPRFGQVVVAVDSQAADAVGDFIEPSHGLHLPHAVVDRMVGVERLHSVFGKCPCVCGGHGIAEAVTVALAHREDHAALENIVAELLDFRGREGWGL